MTDVVQTVESKVAAAAPAVAADVAKVVTEYSFVRANWGKLSAIVVIAAAVGAVVGHIL